MAILLEKRSYLMNPYCPAHRRYELQHHFYPPDVYRLRQIEFEVPKINPTELKAIKGMEIINAMPLEFKKRNRGKFIAITYTGKILLLSESLISLNEGLSKIEIDENYYIDKIGYKTITKI